MGNIINVSFSRSGEINASQINKPSRKVDDALLLPATEDVTKELAKEHASEPIKKVEDIERISKFLIDNERWRDNMLFIVGINFGLRVSDLLQLRFCDLIDDSLTFRTTFPILEQIRYPQSKVDANDDRGGYALPDALPQQTGRLYVQERKQ